MPASQETTTESRLAWGLIGTPVLLAITMTLGAIFTERTVTDFTINVFGKAVVEQPLWLIPISIGLVAAIILLTVDDVIARWFNQERSPVDRLFSHLASNSILWRRRSEDWAIDSAPREY